MSDDTFNLCCAVAAFGVGMLTVFAITVLLFDNHGYYRYRRNRKVNR